MDKFGVLAEFGVYKHMGFEIQDYNELGLNPDGVYQVLRDGDFVRNLYISARGKDIPIYIGTPLNGNPIGKIDTMTLLDGVLLHSVKVFDNKVIGVIGENKLFFSAIAFLYDCDVVSGNYMGVGYDLVMKNPKLHSVSLVEKRREPITL